MAVTEFARALLTTVKMANSVAGWLACIFAVAFVNPPTIRLAGNFEHLRVILAIRKSTISTVSVEKIGLSPIARTRKSWRLRLRKTHRKSTAKKTHTIVFAKQSAFISFFFLRNDILCAAQEACLA